jgi:hypothetical protein
MTNQLQICNWLVDHPDILQLAAQMLNIKDNPLLSASAAAAAAPACALSTPSNNVSVTD